MSLTRVSEPKAVGVCTGCGQPIYRNLAFFNGLPWHYGELRDSGKLANATHYCFDCYSYLTRGKVGYMMISDARWRVCGVCGSTNVKWLGRRDQATVFHP